MPRRVSAALFAGLLVSPAVQAQENDGLDLPDGFSATVVHEGVGPARHLAVRDNGDIYVMTQPPIFGGGGGPEGIVALRDTNGDHKADRLERFTDIQGTGAEFRNGMLYVSDDVTVYRFGFEGDELVPSQGPEVIAEGFNQERQHADKPFAFDNAGNMYVNVGAPSNACQEEARSPGSTGMDPCPLLEEYGGIWRFDADQTGQDQMADGERYATGLRNSIAIEWNNMLDELYVVMHGRDQLNTLWPDLFNAKDNATRVAEEMHIIREGGNHGWPYTFYDYVAQKRVIGPEYGGDGEKTPEAGKYADPVQAFPAHWAPDDLIFYDGKNFPAEYRGGAFIAFHGSWNRAPEPQGGYNVVYQPMKDGKPAGDWEIFIDGFTGEKIEGNNPANARHRPVGLAVGPDGALYVSESQKGRIWRITYDE